MAIKRQFIATFNSVAATVKQDLFSILTPATCMVRIDEWAISQGSDFGDAQAELRQIVGRIGYTTAGSGGTLLTPTPLDGGAAAQSTVRANDTTLAVTGTIKEVYADAWNVMAGLIYQPDECSRIPLPLSTRFVLRLLDDPTDSLTMLGMLKFTEYDMR